MNWRRLHEHHHATHDNGGAFEKNQSGLVTNNIHERIARLSPEKLQLLAERLSERRLAGSSTIKLSSGDGRAAQPPSLGQERLWFADRMEPGSPVYNIPRAVNVEGPLELCALFESLREVVDRHESLRTTFGGDENGVVQVIGRPAVDIPLIDLGAVDERRRDAVAAALATEEARRGFDLTRGPLFRFTLLRLSPERHIFLITLHHIIGDAWSTAVLIDELHTLYAAFTAGGRSALPELPMQYRDYTAWQREFLQRGEVRGQIEYWKKQLAGSSPSLDLPRDRTAAGLNPDEGATRFRSLGEPLVSGLRRLARRENTTLFAPMLAAFTLLLRHWTNRQEIVVATMIAGRNRSEIEKLIGFFVNTLLLRTTFPRLRSFKELMNQVRETTLSALANQDVPFNWVVKMLRPEHGSTHAPPFSVVFTLHNIPMPALEFSGLKLTTMESSRGVAPFDLNLNLLEYTDRITAALEYKTALFEPATIDRLLSQYEAILAKVVRSPRVSLREMDEMLRRLDRDAMSEKEAELEGLRQRQFKSVKRMRVTGS